MAVSVRLSEKEDRIFREYAAVNGMSLSELIKAAVWEKIEDEIDLRSWDEAYAEYLANPVTISHEEAWEWLK